MSNEEDRASRFSKLEQEKAELRAQLDKKDRYIQTLRWQQDRLADQNVTLRAKLDEARIQAEKRNRELDALHYVWCDGGCEGGMSRYEKAPGRITEELVLAAERNTARMRLWLNNRRAKQGELSPQATRMLQGLLDALPRCTVSDCGKIATKVQRGEHGVEDHACDEHACTLVPERTADTLWADVIRELGGRS